MKISVPWIGTKGDWISERGYLFFTVMSFSRLSMQGHRVLSVFTTKEKPQPKEDDGRLMPAARESWIYLSMASLSGQERLYSRLVGKVVPGLN